MPFGPPAEEVTLKVDGVAYTGWKNVSITRGIEALAGGFEVGIVVAAGVASSKFPAIFEEQQVEVSILGQPVITGYVDKRTQSLDGTSRSFTISGRDAAGLLVDSSHDPKKLVWKGVDLLTVVKAVCEPHGINATVQPGLTFTIPPWDRLAINPGDKGGAVIEKACKMVGALPVSDGLGGLQLCRAGSAKATTGLVSGVNVLRATATFDSTQRFYRYLCLGAHAAKVPKRPSKTEGKKLAKANAANARQRGEAFDEEVTRTSRFLLINPEDGANKAYADARAQWEATVRAAKSESVTVTVQGWAQEDGTLWPVNALVDVDIDEVGAVGQMLITQAKYNLGEHGRLTELTLRRPDAYTPQPRIKRGGPGGGWKELRTLT